MSIQPELLKQIPAGRRATLLMRHSARFPILDDSMGHLVGLTPAGYYAAEQFGARLGTSVRPGRLISSPVMRCVETARAIGRGAGWRQAAESHWMLGHPFLDPIWVRLQQGKNGHLPPEVPQLLSLVTAGDRQEPVLDVLVTHDTVLAILVHYLLGTPYRGPGNWPGFLEGMLFWEQDGQMMVCWRSQTAVIPPLPAATRPLGMPSARLAG